jgi:hypothetical protein
MKSQPKSPATEHEAGCLELAPPESALIQFVGRRHTCGFPKSDFRQLDFTLMEIRPQQPHRPSQKLFLFTPKVTVTLLGWRLDSLPELLASGKVNRIHAVDGVLAKLIVKEPLVCSIRIYWPGSTKAITLLPPTTPP